MFLVTSVWSDLTSTEKQVHIWVPRLNIWLGLELSWRECILRFKQLKLLLLKGLSRSALWPLGPQGPFGPLGPLWHLVSFWDYLEPFGICGPSETICDHLELLDLLRPFGTFGPLETIWVHSEPFGFLQNNFAQFGTIWDPLGLFRTFRIIRSHTQFGSI